MRGLNHYVIVVDQLRRLRASVQDVQRESGVVVIILEDDAGIGPNQGGVVYAVVHQSIAHRHRTLEHAKMIIGLCAPKAPNDVDLI